MTVNFSIGNLSVMRNLEFQNIPTPKWAKAWRKLFNEERLQYLLSSQPFFFLRNAQTVNHQRILRPSLRQVQSNRDPKAKPKISENASVTDRFVRPRIVIGRATPI